MTHLYKCIKVYPNLELHLFPPQAKKFAENQPKKEAPPKKEKAAKEASKQQPQQQQDKKEKKKEEKKPAPPAEEMDECEAALASEPKTKDPFAHLPKR